MAFELATIQALVTFTSGDWLTTTAMRSAVDRDRERERDRIKESFAEQGKCPVPMVEFEDELTADMDSPTSAGPSSPMLAPRV